MLSASFEAQFLKLGRKDQLTSVYSKRAKKKNDEQVPLVVDTFELILL